MKRRATSPLDDGSKRSQRQVLNAFKYYYEEDASADAAKMSQRNLRPTPWRVERINNSRSTAQTIDNNPEQKIDRRDVDMELTSNDNMAIKQEQPVQTMAETRKNGLTSRHESYLHDNGSMGGHHHPQVAQSESPSMDFDEKSNEVAEPEDNNSKALFNWDIEGIKGSLEQGFQLTNDRQSKQLVKQKLQSDQIKDQSQRIQDQSQLIKDESQQIKEQILQLEKAIPQVEEMRKLRISNSHLKRTGGEKKEEIARLKTQMARLQGILAQEVKECKNHATKLMHVEEESRSRIKELETRLLLAEGVNQKLNADIEKIRSEVMRSETHSRELADQLQRSEAQCEHLKNQNATVQAKWKVTMRELSSMERAKLNTGRQYEKVSDADLQQYWQRLDYRIRNLSHSLAQHISEGMSIKSHKASSRFVMIHGGDYERIPQDTERSLLLLQAYLWRVAFEFIYPLNDEMAALAGKFEDVRFGLLTTTSPTDAPATAAWFTDKWELIESKLSTKRQAHVVGIEEAELLASFFVKGSARGAIQDAFHLEEELIHILRSARDLNVSMGTSRAVFRCDWFNATEGATPRYDSETMEVTGPQATSSQVMFAIHPRVVKYGNADGHHHDRQMLLLKAKVVLGPNAVQRETKSELKKEDEDDWLLAQQHYSPSPTEGSEGSPVPRKSYNGLSTKANGNIIPTLKNEKGNDSSPAKERVKSLPVYGGENNNNGLPATEIYDNFEGKWDDSSQTNQGDESCPVEQGNDKFPTDERNLSYLVQQSDGDVIMLD